MKRNVKDSVFTFLFSQPAEAKKLYQVLHPEDTDVTEADIKVITLKNVLSNGRYNDLGLQVRGRLIILTEAQSTFCPNAPLRVMLYLEDTYDRYIQEKELWLYGEKLVKIPKPELYVIYTGSRQDVPDVLRLSDMYEGDAANADVDVTVHVLKARGTSNVLEQYVEFCKIESEMVRRYGRSKETIQKIVDQCIEQGILADFFRSREWEVYDVMSILFDQEKVWEMEKQHIQRETSIEYLAKGRAEGRAEGEAEGTMNALLGSIKALMESMETSAEQAMTLLKIPQDDWDQYKKLLANS